MAAVNQIKPKAITSWQRSVSVLVPVLNEVENVRPTIVRLIDALTVTVEDFEIIIIDDGSTDGTGAVADELARESASIRIFHNARNMGLGYCYGLGCEKATKNFFVYIPGDNTWPYRSYVELFGNIGQADIITSFAINPGVRPWARRIVSRMFTLTLNAIFRRRLRYYNGLTIYPAEFLRRKPITTFGFGFQAEVLLKALTSGLSYIEVGLPIDERAAGSSKAVTTKNIFSVALTVFRLVYELLIARRWGPQSLNRRPVSSMTGIRVDELGFEPDLAGEHRSADAKQSVEPKIIVVAGSSSGIGAALARGLSAGGHRVIACARNKERLAEAFRDRPEIEFTTCDVADPAAIRRFCEFVSERTDHVDVLLNCAGGFGSIGAIDQVDGEEWMSTIRGNLFGVFLATQNFLPLLEKSSAPQVISLSGGGAFSPFPNFSAYACSKAAIVRLTETLAIELAPRGIAVNALAPGMISTKAHEATLAAGPERAGQVQFQRTQRLLRQDAELSAARMHTVLRCVEALLSPEYRGLTGKTISANFDPWASDEFRRHISDITQSDLYTMRRTNLVNLPAGLLRTNLMKVWAKHGIQR